MNQKGFAPLFIILGIILVIGIAGGTYYLDRQNTSKPNKLVVTREEDKIDHLSAFIRTITDTSKVQLLYTDIYALPNTPKGVMHCPIDFFARYTLDFYRDDVLILHAVYDPTGCRMIQLKDQESKIASTLIVNFSADLQQTLGLSKQDFYGFQ